MDIITYALAKKIGSPSEAQIESAVDNYLDAHPEATTTVQDGSITKAKLNAELSGKVDEISDINEAMDNYIENLKRKMETNPGTAKKEAIISLIESGLFKEDGTPKTQICDLCR